MPVIVATYVPGDAAANEQDAVDVPPADRTTLAGHEAVSPEGNVIARFTGPDNPERLARVTVLLPNEPAVKDTDEAERL